ncbi:MAG: ABC transporter ATP-binding protein, partial [Actinomycetota bacterium]|nr:ABC transporter ATP-binding protein [Actinomycetota bacterium]
ELRKTIIFVTHNMREAIRLGDRVVLMGSHPGRIVYEESIPLPHPRVMDSPDVATRAASLTARLKEQGHAHVG